MERTKHRGNREHPSAQKDYMKIHPLKTAASDAQSDAKNAKSLINALAVLRTLFMWKVRTLATAILSAQRALLYKHFLMMIKVSP